MWRVLTNESLLGRFEWAGIGHPAATFTVWGCPGRGKLDFRLDHEDAVTEGEEGGCDTRVGGDDPVQLLDGLG